MLPWVISESELIDANIAFCLPFDNMRRVFAQKATVSLPGEKGKGPPSFFSDKGTGALSRIRVTLGRPLSEWGITFAEKVVNLKILKKFF
jgi:hypothetical protein